MEDDPISKSLRDIKTDWPEPRRDLSDEEKMNLVRALGGPKTVRAILSAKKTLPPSRIPFLFNSLETVAVLEVLANDMEEVLRKLEGK